MGGFIDECPSIRLRYINCNYAISSRLTLTDALIKNENINIKNGAHH